MIEKLDLIQSEVDHFEKSKKGKGLLLVVIAAIGLFSIGSQKTESCDGSCIAPTVFWIEPHFNRPHHTEKKFDPLCLTEYSSRIATGKLTHVIQFNVQDIANLLEYKYDKLISHFHYLRRHNTKKLMLQIELKTKDR